MSLYRWWIALRNAAVVGVIVAAAVGGLLFAYVVTRPAEYEARFALVAAANGDAQPGQVDLGALVSLTLPSLTELAHSPAVLDTVVQGIAGAPDVNKLSGQITVQLVPASGVARITVENGNPRVAAELAAALSTSIRSLNLLSPVGTYRGFGPGSISNDHKAAPDVPLGTGFGVAAAVLAGLLAASLYSARHPRIVSRRQVAALLNESGVPIITYRPRGKQSDEVGRALSSMADEIVPVGNTSSKPVRQLKADLRQSSPSQIEPSVWKAARAILVVSLGVTTPDQLSNSRAVLAASRIDLAAVVLV